MVKRRTRTQLKKDLLLRVRMTSCLLTTKTLIPSPLERKVGVSQEEGTDLSDLYRRTERQLQASNTFWTLRYPFFVLLCAEHTTEL